MSACGRAADLPVHLRQAFLTAGFPAGLSVCVGFSGGLDSRVLLDLLAQLRTSCAFSLSAVHVHHGLSPHADAWAEFCERQAAALDVPCEIVRVQVDRGVAGGLEAAARLERHRVLAAQACDLLALAHHRDDQAETLLFRLLRGSGVHGSGAMRPLSGERPRLWRPLLGLGRDVLEAYARRRSLGWVEDESNGDPAFRRNFLRHRVMPELRRAFPGADKVLARAAEQFAEAADLLDQLADMDLVTCGAPEVRREALCALDEPRLRNALYRLLTQQGGRLAARTRLQEAVRQLVALPRGAVWRHEIGGVALCLYREVLWCEPQPETQPTLEQVWRGEPMLDWAGGRVVFEPASGSDALCLPCGTCLGARTPGLRLQLGVGRPHRALKVLCQEAGIPPWWRDRLPVLRVNGRAVWVGGVGSDVEARCAPGEAGLRVRWEPAGRISFPTGTGAGVS